MKFAVRFKDQVFPEYYYDDLDNTIYCRNCYHNENKSTKHGNVGISIIDDRVPASIEYDPIPHIVLNGQRYRLDYIIAYTVLGNPDGIIRLLHLDNDMHNCDWNNLEWLTKYDIQKKYLKIYNVLDVEDIPEIWKPYQYPTRPDRVCEISNYGNIRDLNHVKIEPKPDIGGYATIAYQGGNNSARRFFIHRAVAELFIDNPNPQIYTVVNHLDGDKWNNCVWNLEWASESMNMDHAHLTELESSKNRYDERLIHEVCKALSKGIKAVDVAKQFGLTPKFVSKIYTRTRWTSISKNYVFPSKTFSDNEKKYISSLIEEGFKGAEIAQKLGMKYDTKFISTYERLKRNLRLGKNPN